MNVLSVGSVGVAGTVLTMACGNGTVTGVEEASVAALAAVASSPDAGVVGALAPSVAGGAPIVAPVELSYEISNTL